MEKSIIINSKDKKCGYPFLIPIDQKKFICWDPRDPSITLFDLIKHESKEIKFAYEFMQKSPDGFKIVGMVVIPKPGDIMVSGVRERASFGHAMILAGNRQLPLPEGYNYFEPKIAKKQYMFDCVTSGCALHYMLYLTDGYKGAKQSYPYTTNIIRYKGYKEVEVRSKVIELSKILLSTANYSIQKACKLVTGSCKTNVDTIQHLITGYRKKLKNKESFNLVCSSFVAIVYLLSFSEYLNTEQINDVFPLNPEYCLPRDLHKLVTNNPKNWTNALISGWGSSGVGTIDPDNDTIKITDKSTCAYITRFL
jgi:hypothetical protein